MWVNLDLCSFGYGQPNGWGGRERSDDSWSSRIPIVPFAWDTQFKAGAAYNERSINILGRLHDGQPTPAFYYTMWRSQRTDSIPEFTAYFSSAGIRYIGLVNGSVQSPEEYRNRARVKELRVVCYTSAGQFTDYIQVPDQYSREPQVFELSPNYPVATVEIYVTEIYEGAGDRYEVNIGEISFR